MEEIHPAERRVQCRGNYRFHILPQLPGNHRRDSNPIFEHPGIEPGSQSQWRKYIQPNDGGTTWVNTSSRTTVAPLGSIHPAERRVHWRWGGLLVRIPFRRWDISQLCCEPNGTSQARLSSSEHGNPMEGVARNDNCPKTGSNPGAGFESRRLKSANIWKTGSNPGRGSDSSSEISDSSMILSLQIS